MNYKLITLIAFIFLCLIYGLIKIGNNNQYPTTSNDCTRNQSYVMPPEFTRALSLINQRFSSHQNTEIEKISTDISKIANCLDIQYASSDNALGRAEGIFVFDKDSSINDLKIYVSPKYKAKDDLVTALLLSHEISHAIFLAQGFLINTTESCYQDEANAFTHEALFLGSLNPEEITSLTQRISVTPEIYSFFDMLNKVSVISRKQTGKIDFSQQFTVQYVKAIPEYQSECGAIK